MGKVTSFFLDNKRKTKCRLNEKTSTQQEMIGAFQVMTTYREDDIVYEFMTDRAFCRVHTDAGNAIGKEFIENLVKK